MISNKPMESTAQYRATQCPSQGVLLAFDSGKLSLAEIETVSAHLGSCETCLAFLDSRNPRRPDNAFDGKMPVMLSDEESAKSSLLDDTAFEKIRKNAQLQRMKERAKAIKVDVDGKTATWVPAPTAPPKQLEENLPEKIGRYFVIKKLGKGAFANVYLARDPEQDRLVAIKVPHPHTLNSPEKIEKFLEEARTAATLDHPHIVREFDFGRMSEGFCYVVMRYIEGTTLEAAMLAKQNAREKFSYQRIAELCIHIADALDHAHQKGIFHRDVKPANILLDREGQPYVADFGLAIHEDSQHLHIDEVAGTWHYMSPEQVRGEANLLDGRSDVWSLGVVLYELFTQKKPFTSKDKPALRREILEREPKPLRSHDREIPEVLQRICLSCLAKDVSTRSASAAEVAESLRTWLHGRRRFYQLRAWGVAALLGIVIIGLFIWATEIGWFGSGTIPSDKDESPGPALTATPDNPSKKISLLEIEPVVVFGHPRSDPIFDSSQSLYSVSSERQRWIARTFRGPTQPIRLHSNVGLKDWVGKIGFAWQVHGIHEQRGSNNRWMIVEVYRFDEQDPLKLMVRKVAVSGANEAGEIVSQTRLSTPKNPTAQLEMIIERGNLKVSFDEQTIELVSSEVRVNSWMEEGELTVALTGDGERATFRDVQLELQPSPK